MRSNFCHALHSIVSLTLVNTHNTPREPDTLIMYMVGTLPEMCLANWFVFGVYLSLTLLLSCLMTMQTDKRGFKVHCKKIGGLEDLELSCCTDDRSPVIDFIWFDLCEM